MRLRDYLEKAREAETRGAATPITTPGGAEIASVERLAERPGEAPRALPMLDPDLAERRARIYRELWGEPEGTARDESPRGGRIPSVDVHLYPPNEEAGRDFFTLVTAGMGDLPMRVPPDVGRAGARTELCLYVDHPHVEYFELLRALARLPHEHGAWLGPGHTVPNGDPPAPIVPGSELSVALLLATPLDPDAKLPERLRIAGDPVGLLWVVPITEAECTFKLERGTQALLELFDEKEHPFVLDPARRSHV